MILISEIDSPADGEEPQEAEEAELKVEDVKEISSVWPERRPDLARLAPISHVWPLARRGCGAPERRHGGPE